ncbi:MAG: domain protein, putative component of TonB system [Myxococcaceae bacterium]|nr:domain protein, putative component of TonB system [Myxococcaceae bacterium]
MRRSIAAVVSLLALTALAAPPPAGPAAAAKKPTVAILYFDYDQGGELEALKKGLAQMLITDLVGHPGIALVERARMQEIFEELKLNETKKVDPETAVKIGKLLGAQFVVIGGYFVVQGQMAISTRTIDVATTLTVGGLRVRGPPDTFFDLEAELSQKIYQEFTTRLPAAAAPAKEGAAPARRPAKSNLKVALGYSRALGALDKKDKATARKELEAVVKEQPDFVLASLDLADLVK